MCRNIRVLYNFQPPSTEEEIRAAAVQYVRKVCGLQKPSSADEKAFEVHQQQAAFKKYVAEAVPLLASRERHFWKRME